jgi:alkylated DNA repair protein (DNA oxidative demethylase)
VTAPPGFLYHPDFISEAEEADLLSFIRALPFSEVRMRGVPARRRTAHFGWLYGYETWRIEPGPRVPDFLLPLRARAAALLGVDAARLEEVLVTEYPAGAGIGWHRDAPMFGSIVGVSLLSACRFRFRRGPAGGRTSHAVLVEPRSAYVLAGAARSEWQHSIPPTVSARYSVTFRTLRESRRREPRARGGASAAAEGHQQAL